ncbi:MAG: hypothetical protein H0T66_03755 [Geodermatophilaceae bacterium]|nr:hypothetical protein [Geodermatophilaceae bacterium]MDQ3456130.1 hypothetical protein [Actinomycetota bacterium]
MTHVLQRMASSRLWHHGPALVLAAGLALLLGSGPDDGELTRTIVAVAVLQAGLVLTWSAALGFRGYVGSLLIGAGAAAAADVAALDVGDQFGSTGDDRLGPLAAVLALALILAFVHQLTRRSPRVVLTESMAGVTLLSALVVAPSAYLVLAQLSEGPALLRTCVASLGAALVVGHLVDLLVPVPRIVEGVPRGLLGFVLGTGAGMYAAVRTEGTDGLVEQLGSLILGGVLGGLACLLAIGASYAAVERRGSSAAKAVVQAALPFAAAAPVAYFVAVLVAG